LGLRLVFFDLDGTLKLCPDPYRHINEHLGFPDTTRSLSAMFERGEIDSDEWIRRAVALWRGLHRSKMLDIVREIPYAPGARETVQHLQTAGITIAVVSTGLQIHADTVKAELGLDHAVANEVLFEEETATGEVAIRVHEKDKASVVSSIMEIEGISSHECLAVGDGEADVGMFEKCRIGVAIRPASEKVRRAAHFVLEDGHLDDLVPVARALVPEWHCL
jgi:phosphoserine phosphatase